MIRSGQVHYLTGPEITEPASRHRLGIVWDRTVHEPPRDGQAHRSLRAVPYPTCARGGVVMCAISTVWRAGE